MSDPRNIVGEAIRLKRSVDGVRDRLVDDFDVDGTVLPRRSAKVAQQLERYGAPTFTTDRSQQL